MEIILLKDVAGLGERFQTRTVASGYARNFLLPRGLALPASPANLARLERLRQEELRASERARAEFERVRLQLKNARLVMKAKANEQGYLYGAIGPADIAAMLAGRQIVLSPEALLPKEPIKTIGEHQVELRAGDQASSFTLVVEPD